MFKKIKDYLFPIFCIKCNKEGFYCCSECLKEVKQKIKIIQVDFRLKNNQRAVYYDRLTALFDYKNNRELRELIHLFKYEYCKEIEDVWDYLFDSLLDYDFMPDVIIPVPLHLRRKRERGFNQSEILAFKLWQNYFKRGKKVVLNNRDLIRKRYTTKQMSLGGLERQKNLKNAFNWQGNNLTEKTVLLVDDVFTTGTTLNECAKILKSYGAYQVDSMVLAKD